MFPDEIHFSRLRGMAAWAVDEALGVLPRMEGAMLAGCLNHWGFSRFAMIFATLLDRLEGDQVTSTPEQLRRYCADPGMVLFNYLKPSLPRGQVL